MDFGGAEFTILQRTGYDKDFNIETETGDIVDDAVYNRNRTVEERFNVKLVNHAIDGDWYDPAIQFNNTLRSSVMANDGSFDLVAGYAAMIPGVITDGLFMNLNSLEYLDFTKPWWSKEVAEEMTINGKAYMMAGDITLTLWQYMNCILFNKKLAEDYNVGDMYKLVRDGDWTFDKMTELTKDVYTDLNGDGNYDEEDLYGYVTGASVQIDMYKEAFEINVTVKDDDGFLKYDIVNERAVDAINKLKAYFNDSGNAFMYNDSGEMSQKIFSEGRAMLAPATLGVTENLRSMDDDFGILPYPKFNKEQDKYHSTSQDAFSLILIPLDVKNADMSAIITEALCAEGHKQVVPKFYDVALKAKNARDDDSAEMIDMIRDGLIFNWGYLNSIAVLDSAGHIFVNVVRGNVSDLQSGFDTKASACQAKLEKALEIYRD